MSVYIQQYWPVRNLTAICQLQNVAANASAVLNGTFANPLEVGQISLINQGFSRVVSITSANNLSARTFTVVGVQNGAKVTEAITGPNNATVYGDFAFDVVTSVTTNGTSNGVSVGTGDTGYLPLIQVNNISFSPISWTVGAFLPLSPATGITYQGYTTIDNIVNNRISFDAMGSAGSGLLYNTIFPANQQTSKQYSSTGPTAKYILVQVAASTNPTTDTLIVSFLQS